MIKNNYVLIQGLGLNQGGIGAASYFAQKGRQVLVTDLKSIKELQPSVKALEKFDNIRFVLGKHREKDFTNAKLIISSPVVPPGSKYVQLAREKDIPVYCPMSYFFKHKQGMVIGITGTRGKSTTASLIYQILNKNGQDVYLGGNIGRSVLDFLDDLSENSISVLEISSFMLEWLAKIKISPEIAVLTNIYSDHLNWHGSLEKYIQAKKQVFKYQDKKDVAFLNLYKPEIKKLKSQIPGKFRDFYKEEVDFQELNLDILHSLYGEHNQENIKAVFAVSRYLGVKDKLIKDAVKNYQGLYGRQMYFGEVKGVKIINDTCATIPEAVIAAIKRFQDYPLVLLTGGKDKGVSYQQLAEIINKDQLKYVFILGGSGGEKLKKELKKIGFSRFLEVDSLEVGVSQAMNIAGNGDVFLFSPGGSSFERFANEFERGRRFDELVRAPD